jgi:hypothetical protein
VKAFKTIEDVHNDLAECDRREREMELYGPYDPRREEVMEGWRSAEFAPLRPTADQRKKEAELWREAAGVALDVSKSASADYRTGYTPDELAATEAFRADTLSLAGYLDVEILD